MEGLRRKPHLSFLETIRRAKAFLQEQGRVSLRALKLEFGLDEEQLDALIEELVDIQQLAARQGKALAWVGPAATAPAVAISPEPESREAGLRQLTVVFCDLVDSTHLARCLDVEDLREALSAYQEAVASVVERFDGHVAQYLGDGVLVYFGWPRAHEDDPVRALRAGLEILADIPALNTRLAAALPALVEQPLRVRIGVHTGPVVVGELGRGDKREQLALGDTVNLAARLQGLAEPDALVISDATRHLVRGAFLFEELGEHSLKGIDEPITVSRVLRPTGVQSRLDLAAVAGLTPLIGREHEVALLLDRWQQAVEGHGQAVLLSGEAGMGKSRLAQVLRERVAEQPHSWIELRASAYHQNTTLYPVTELLRQALLFTPEDAVDTQLARLRRGLEAAGFALPEVLPLFASLLSLPLPSDVAPSDLSPEAQRERTLESLCAWVVALAEAQPLILVVEDLHWTDPSTLELLGMLLEQAPTLPIFLLLTFRPSFEPPFPERSHVARMLLRPLTRAQMESLVTKVAGRKALPNEVVEQIVSRTDGVPLFVEELTKTILESDLLAGREGRFELARPLPDLAIPATLQDSLMERLDRLGPAKEVAQLCAALGREFSHELLGAVSRLEPDALGRLLAGLASAELLYQRGVPPRAVYHFKHALIQEMAYQSLLKRTRRGYHARIAQALEERFPERIEREPELIARHYEGAGLTERAIDAHRRAGELATQRSANEEAIAHLSRALELLGTLPESAARDQRELELQLAIGSPLSAARGWSDPESETSFRRARELASRIGDVPELPRVLVGLAVAYYVKGDLATSAELAKESLGAAERVGDGFDLLSAHYAVGCPRYWRGETPQALQHLEQAIRLYDADEHAPRAYAVGIDRGVVSRNYAASSYWACGHPDRALTTVREAVDLAQRVEHPLSLVTAIGWEAWIHQLRREHEQTLTCAEETMALSERFGFPLFLGLGRTLHGWALASSQRAEEGVADIQQALASLAQSGTGIGAPQILGSLGEACWRAGHHEDALRALGLGIERAKAQGQHYYDAELHRLRAEVLLDSKAGGVEEAEALLQRALEITRGQQARSFELRAAASLARLWQREGKGTEARDLLQPVYDWFTEGFDTRDLKDAKALLEELS